MDIQVASIQVMASKGICQLVQLPQGKDARPTIASEVLDFYGNLARMGPLAELALGFCVFRKRPLVVTALERHLESQELLFAVDDDFIIMAALHDVETNGPDFKTLCAARVPRSAGLVFHSGVWHGVPFPFKQESFALVGFGAHTTDSDMHFFDFTTEVAIVI